MSQQIIENEGFIKHQTNITSDNILASINGYFNLNKRFKVYAEIGTDGVKTAYGLGLRIPILNGATIIYIPILTEQGLLVFNSMEFISYSLNMNISNFRFF